MTKKFISMLLALVMVVGLVPAMSVSAADDVLNIFQEDFEEWKEGTKYYEGFTGPDNLNTISNNGIGRFSIGKYLMAEIVSMDGFDGNPTKAIKVISDHSDTGLDLDVGQGRFKFIGSGVKYDSKGWYAPSKNYVTEFKMYIPESINSGGETITQNIGSLNFGPFGKSGSSLVLRYTNSSGSTKTITYTGVLTPGWHKFTIVQLFGSESGKMIYYHNDKLLSYKEVALKYAYNMIQFTSTINTPGRHLIFDDFKVYEGLVPTTASSVYSGATNIPKNEKVTVNFTEMLLDVPDASPASISKANVKMIESDGSGDGKEIEIKSVTLGADKKSIVIDPVKDYENGKEYVVKVSGLKDMYDQTIEEYEFSFTTAGETSLAISAPEFTMVDFDNGTTKNAEKLENGFVNASYKVTNNASSVQKLVMFAVLKDGDTIESIQLKDVTIAAKATVNFNGGFKVEDAQNKKMEVYIWDDMRNMTPLAAKYAIDATSKTVVPN